MASDIYTPLIGVFCTIISSIVTFILTKRKYNTEVDAQQIRNMDASFETYKKVMEESLESQKKLMEATITSQNKKIDELQEENKFLRKQVNDLQFKLISFFGTKFNSEEHKEQ